MNQYTDKKRRQAFAIQKKNRERLLKLNPNLNDESGIYFLTRVDENGFKFAYIGQSVKVLTRLCSHLQGYEQHIDKSLKAHSLYDADKNPHGWKVGAINYPTSKLDEMERCWIRAYAEKGFQMRNVSLGGQNEGRNMISETKAPKGYRQGVQQGRKNLAKELSHIIEKHLSVSLKPEKIGNKVSEEQFEKFKYLLAESTYEEGQKE